MRLENNTAAGGVANGRDMQAMGSNRESESAHGHVSVEAGRPEVGPMLPWPATLETRAPKRGRVPVPAVCVNNSSSLGAKAPQADCTGWRF